MVTHTERDRLNRLIETCRDAARGFELAAAHVDEEHLKAFFTEMAGQRKSFADELEPHAQRLGGSGAGDGTASAALHRAWMTVKDAMRYDADGILAEAVRGEAAAANVYAAEMQGVLPPEARTIIERQYAMVLGSQRRLDEFYLRAAARR